MLSLVLALLADTDQLDRTVRANITVERGAIDEVARDRDVLFDFARRHPGQLYEWVRTRTPDSAEAVLIGGNGFRAVGVIQALEQDLERQVLTANQVAFWAALRLSGTRASV